MTTPTANKSNGNNSWVAMAKENRAYADKRKAAKDAGLPMPLAPNAKAKQSGFLPAAGRGAGGIVGNGGASAVAPPSFARGFQRPNIVPVPLRDFSWNDVQYQGQTTGKVKLIPLRNPTGGPMCTRLTGGGSIPFTIGLQTTQNYDKPKTRMSFTVDDADERKSLERMHRDCTAYVMNIATRLYPGITEFDYSTLVARVLSEVKAKKDGGEWPQLASVNVDPQSLFSEDARSDPLLQIINESTASQVFNLPDILGQRWTSMTIEWQFLVIGEGEHKETKAKFPLISISRRLRGHMYITVDENQFHLVLPEDRAMHDASECKRKHVKVEPINTFRLLEHARVNSVQKKDKTRSARIEHIDGGNVVIKLCGSGTVPSLFGIDTNEQGNLVLTVTIESLTDEAGLDQLSVDLQTLALSRRDEYFEGSTMAGEFLKECIKPILNVRTPEAIKGGFARAFGCIFDYEKLNTTCSIIDGNGQRVTNPEAIKGKKWKEFWFMLRCTYVQKKGNLFQVGFSKRFVHMELEPDMESFHVSDEQHFEQPPPLDSTVSPNAKRVC
jgi:hypothetical protein